MKYQENSVKYHHRNMNCCQSVAIALYDIGEINAMQRDMIFKAAEGFGKGLGDTEGVCGALSGAILYNGLKNVYGSFENPVSKADTHKISTKIKNEFKDATGGCIFCKDILTNEEVLEKATKDKELKRLREELKLAGYENKNLVCDYCIKKAVEITEKY